jgi:very-short-patch-repair endonuclease
LFRDRTGRKVGQCPANGGSFDAAVADIAARQHGIVSLPQLRDLGMTGSGVRKRVARRQLHRVHAGVFAVGHTALRSEGHWMAAVIACGPRAVLSHRSAAALWDLRPDPAATVELIATGSKGRGKPEITAHRCQLSEDETTEVRGIPCTTITRTLIDVAPLLTAGSLRRALNQAEISVGIDFAGLEEAARSGRRGARALRTLVEDRASEPQLTRSELEERFLALCRRAGLPRPAVNTTVPVDGAILEVDFSWPSQHLVVEADGYRFHGTASAFERDRRRDQLLAQAGWQVIRCTWRQVTRGPEDLAATIRSLLTA